MIIIITITANAVPYTHIYCHSTPTRSFVQRKAEWLRSWTRNPGIRGSIPAPLSLIETLGKFLIHTASVHPAVMGTRWNENWLRKYFQQQKVCCIHRGDMKLCKSEFQYLGQLGSMCVCVCVRGRGWGLAG